VKINRYFLLKKLIFFVVSTPQKIFTIFTAVDCGAVVHTNSSENRSFLRVDIEKVKQSEHIFC
jgi:hypothetical protein